MQFSDFLSIVQWWSVFLIGGILFFPFTSKILAPFSDKGYAFAKIFSLLLTSYVIFIFSFGLLPFSTNNVLLLSLITCIGFFVFYLRNSMTIHETKSLFLRHWKILLFEEIVFFVALLFWSFIRMHQPDIYGLEKYMDVGFVNAILKSSFFPPKDMWFTPFSINYYYFGHFMTAVLVKISHIPSTISYNLMIATLFAFCFTLSFSLIYNTISFIQKNLDLKKITKKLLFLQIFISFLTACFVSLGGNLHILYMFFTPYSTEHPVPFTSLSLAISSSPNGYWYPNATRFIYNTIHEFPLYSFVVSDLHGHVLSIPIVLTIIAVLLSYYYKDTIKIMHAVFISFLLATAYMTNAWDGAIYLLLTLFTLIAIEIQKNWKQKIKNTSKIKSMLLILKTPERSINVLYYLMIVIAGFFIFTLPFSLHFKPFVGGIGILCAPTFLTNLQKIGPFLFEVDHCQKSPLWQLLVLHGFYYFFILSFLIFLQRTKKIIKIDIFMFLLMLLGTILIIVPEFIYLKDIYPAHYRANTMFKLVYQSFIMLSLVSGYVLYRIIQHIQFLKSFFPRVIIFCFLLISVIFSALILYYPVTAVSSYYNSLTTYKGLDGTTYLKTLHPDDYAAIQWINSNISGQPVIVEAQGDSYTDYARISTYTGLPTLLGWTVHEWLWRGTYDIPAPRIAEIEKIYQSKNSNEVKAIIKKYDVKYIYVGDLERQKYPTLHEEIIKKLAKEIYRHGDTRIYQVKTTF